MKIVSFFSFKGGVGRTALLANLGALWASEGKVVLLIDMDLVAPGLSYLPLAGPYLDPESGGGMSDLLMAFYEGGWEGDEINFVPPSSLLREMELAPDRVTAPGGRLLLIDAGTRVGELSSRRWMTRPGQEGDVLSSIPPQQAQAGERRDQKVLRGLAEEFRRDLAAWRIPATGGQPERGIDYVLIDCRTGYAELQDLSLGYLADQMVVVSGLNDQNLRGLELTLEALKKGGRIPIDMFAAQVLVVFSPVPAAEDAAVLEALERGLRTIDAARRVTRSGIPELAPPTALIHYTPFLATSDDLVAIHRPKALYASEVRRIADLVTGTSTKVPEDELIKEARSKALKMVPLGRPAARVPDEPAEAVPRLPASPITDLPGWSWPFDSEEVARARLEELAPPNPEVTVDRAVLATLLCHSISLTSDEKKRILEAFPKLSQFQVDELCQILGQEQQKFVKLGFDQPQHRKQLLDLYYKHQREWAGLMLDDQRAGLERFLLAPLRGTTLFAVWEDLEDYWVLLAHDLVSELSEADGAREALQRARGLAEDDAAAAAKFLAAWASEDKGKTFPEAAEELASEIAAGSPAVDFFVARNRMRRLGTMDDEGRTVLVALLEDPPADGDLCRSLGRFAREEHTELARKSEAVTRKAVELLPENAVAWLGLGNLLQDHLERYEESEQAYRKAIELDPKYALPWNNLGLLLRAHLGRYEESEQACRKAIELDPKYAWPWSNLGLLLQDHLGRYEESEQAYRKAIELDSKNTSPWNNLGNLLRDHLGRYEESEQAYRKAIELDPKSSRPWTDLGLLSRRRRFRYSEAKASFVRGLEIEPSGRYPEMNLGHLLLAAGERREGRGHLETALRGLLKKIQYPDDVGHAIRLSVELEDIEALKELGPRLADCSARLPNEPFMRFATVVAELAAPHTSSKGFVWRPVLERLESHGDTYSFLGIVYDLAVARPDLWEVAASFAKQLLALADTPPDTFKDVPTSAEFLDRFRPFAECLVKGPEDPDDPLFISLED